MAITPQTNLFLIKVPIEIDNKNQITFTNKQNQLNYFMSLPHLEIDNISYQRKDNVIRYPGHIDSILEYNYCVYQNENYTNKWFYAFITGMRYVNDGMTEITIATDVWQTWQFDITFKQSFIEREMINVVDDIAGSNLIPEGLETGEFKVQAWSGITGLDGIYCLAYASNELTIDETQYTFNGTEINGIPTSVFYILTDNIQLLLEKIGSGNTDKIVTIFTIPKFCVQSILDDEQVTANYIIPLTNSIYYTVPDLIEEFLFPSTLDGYTPRNKKLLTYPYRYFGFNAPNGSQKIYRYEDFNTENPRPQFKMISELNPNPNVYIMPMDYRGCKNSGENVNEFDLDFNIIDCATLNGYPTLSVVTDYFNTWLAQNSEIVSLQMNQEQFNYEIGQIQSGISGINNIASGAINQDLNSLSSGINLGFNLASSEVNHEYYIKNQLAQIEKQKLLPDNVSLSASNATLVGYGVFNLQCFIDFTIKRQFAERIDKFFDMYGYLTNNVKIPNINNRPNWNYIKTIGVNIEGYIPQQDLQAIKNMFDSGITLWHNTNTFLDYSQNNR